MYAKTYIRIIPIDILYHFIHKILLCIYIERHIVRLIIKLMYNPRKQKSATKRKSSVTKHKTPIKKRKTSVRKSPIRHRQTKPKKIILNDCILDNVRHLVVVGDLHGDYDIFVKLLRKARLINAQLHWTGKDTVLIQMGDVTDMKSRSAIGDEYGKEIKIYNLLIHLQEEASRQGGYVYILLGNHEIMNVMGYMDYASEDNLKNFGGEHNRKNLFKPGGKMSRFLAAYTYGMIKVNGYIFVHGSIPPNFNYGIREFNKYIREYLLGTRKIENENKIFEPFWNRTFGEAKVSRTLFDKVMRKYDANGMVVGHTIQSNINQRWGGRLWRVDVGLSACFGRHNDKRLQYLEFINRQWVVNK